MMLLNRFGTPWLLTAGLLFVVLGAAQEQWKTETTPKRKLAAVVIRVEDDQSQNPVTVVDIFLSVQGTDYECSILSDDEGVAECKDVPIGIARVQATKSGWKTAGRDVDLKAGTVMISLTMTKD